ncbi:PemB family protein [Halapricum desulfuricans]|uniref:Lipoprotein NosD family n=1 Tax=Halapricum desulfuricans TaxID=2841257 RepID=A0A897NHQ3_9EURY|nr:hypothetical protein [Halapricum desulfuricans]QSG10419.1 Lipoprotein NosD family [Halapricum desulfuricans]
MTKRRKFLLGMGSLAAGGAAAIGSGAFTNVEASRSMDVAVAGDESAYLSLAPTGSPNSQDYVSVSNGQIQLNLGETDNNGSGFNKDAVTEIDNLLQVANQGTQTIYFWVTLSGGNDFDDGNLYFYPNGDADDALNNGDGTSDGDSVLGLTPGESATIGLQANLGDISDTSVENLTATFHASASRGAADASDPVDDSGGSFSIVANDGSGDFTNLQTAINNAQGSTIAVKDTGTPYTVSNPKLEIDKQGLEIRGLRGKPTVEYKGGYPDSSGPFPNEPAISISAADVTLESLRFEIFGVGSSGSNSLKITGGSPLVQITDLGTEMTNVDLSMEGTFDGSPGFVAFNVPASKGTGEAVFEYVLAEDNTGGDPNGNAWLSTAGLFRDTSSGWETWTNGGTNVARTATIRNSEFKNGITVDAHPGNNQSIEITDNSFYGGSNDAGTSEGIQPSPSGGGVTIESNAFEYVLDVDDEGDSNEKIKFAGLPKTINGSNVGDVSMAQKVGEDNQQADGSGDYEDAAVLIVGVDGGPYSNSTYEMYSS